MIVHIDLDDQPARLTCQPLTRCCIRVIPRSLLRATRPSIMRFATKIPLLISLLGLAPWLIGCGQTAAQPPIKVVATIGPLADWARQVGQQRVSVTQLVPVGVDPRTYTPTESDRRAIAEAHVVLFNGLNLEPWLIDAVEQIKPPHMVSLDLSQYIGIDAGSRGITRAPLVPNGEDDSAPRSRELVFIPPTIYSQYLWLDPGPAMAQRALTLIADTYMRVDPDHVLFYRRNAERYNGELENLDNWIKREIQTWPRLGSNGLDTPAMLAPTRSWYYFAAHYNIDLRTLDHINTFEPPLPASVPLFADQFSNQPELVPLADGRTPDAFLRPLGNDNYIQLIRNNVETLARGLHRALSRHEPINQSFEAP